MANNVTLRKKLDEIQSQVGAEKEWWEKKRASIQTEFMKELDGSKSTGKAGSEDDGVLVDRNTPAGTPSSSSKKKKGKK
jgi:translocation protein SEC66